MNMYDEIHELVKRFNSKYTDLELEDEIFAKAYTLFINKIGAEKTADSPYRTNGWICNFFRLNDIEDMFWFHTRLDVATATYKRCTICAAVSLEKLVSKYITKLNEEQDGE